MNCSLILLIPHTNTHIHRPVVSLQEAKEKVVVLNTRAQHRLDIWTHLLSHQLHTEEEEEENLWRTLRT